MSSHTVAARTAVIAAVLLLVFGRSGARAATPAPDAPPAGLHASTTTVDAVLSAWHTANGTRKTKLFTEVEEDAVTSYGLSGTYRDVTIGDNYRETSTLGPVTTQNGRYNGQRWRVNENGIVIYMIGVHKRNQVDAQVVHAALDAPTKYVTLAGEVDAPISAYVLKVNPPDGRLKWLFIDKKTSLLDGEDAAYPEKRVSTRYEDYRPVNGIMQPWHTHVSDGRPENDEDYTVQSDRVNIPVPESDVNVPSGLAPIASFPADATSVRLPARISEQHVIVRLTINGRGLDFLLDSGASSIVLDVAVAKELGIKTFGKSIQTTAGSYSATQAIVPEIDVGPVTLHNTYVDCLPFSEEMGMGTKVVGLLGFDFIANAVVSIDYQHNAVYASPPGKFTKPANAIELGATLDDGVPYVQAQVGNAVGQHFILDTGSFAVMVFSPFADAHPDDLADEGLGKSINAYFPTLSASGVGGEIPMSLTQVASYRFGSVNFTDFLLYRTHGRAAFEGEDDDGLVGYDALRFFTVTLDYRNGEIYLQPGPLLVKTAATPAPSPRP